jgi:hypothetical protein
MKASSSGSPVAAAILEGVCNQMAAEVKRTRETAIKRVLVTGSILAIRDEEFERALPVAS